LNINFCASSLNGYGIMHYFLNNTKIQFVFYFHDVTWTLWSN